MLAMPKRIFDEDGLELSPITGQPKGTIQRKAVNGELKNFAVSKFEPNQKVGLLTLIEKNYDGDNLFGKRVYRGFWRAQCECGEELAVHHLALKAGLKSGKPKGLACPDCRYKLPKRPRKKMTTARPPADHQGKIFGRLAVGEWKCGTGWICVCFECEEIVLVRYSGLLGIMGARRCGRPCGRRDWSDNAIEFTGVVSA